MYRLLTWTTQGYPNVSLAIPNSWTPYILANTLFKELDFGDWALPSLQQQQSRMAQINHCMKNTVQDSNIIFMFKHLDLHSRSDLDTQKFGYFFVADIFQNFINEIVAYW